jgi:hypothetical protein
MRQAFLRDQEGAARVDAIDQIVALHGHVENRSQPYGAGVIEADVDAAEPSDGRGNRCLDLFLLSDITDERQRSSAAFLDLSRCRIPKSWPRLQYWRHRGLRAAQWRDQFRASRR